MAPPTFECGVCSEDKPQSETLFVGPGKDALCKACFIGDYTPKFQAAIHAEHVYHNDLLWGPHRLQARHFIETLGNDLVAALEAKEIEYNTPAKMRIYCTHISSDKGQCLAFLGSREKTPLGSEIICETCSAKTVVEPPPRDEEDWAKEGLERGRHYQLCPGCAAPISLAEACNFIQCTQRFCRTGFCFLCGEKTFHESDHWTVGKPCTKFGRPDALRPMYDPVPAPEERSRYARLHVIPFLHAFWQTMQEKEHRLPGWYKDPNLWRYTILYLKYQWGHPDQPYGPRPCIVGRQIAPGQTLNFLENRPFALLSSYFEDWVDRLVDTLAAYEGIRELEPAAEDDVIEIPDAEANRIEDEQARFARDDDGMNTCKAVGVLEILRAWEVSMQARNRSLPELVPWTMDLPPGCEIFYLYTTKERDPRGTRSAQCQHILISQEQVTPEQRQAVLMLENLLLGDQNLFSVWISDRKLIESPANLDFTKLGESEKQYAMVDMREVRDCLHPLRAALDGPDHEDEVEDAILKHEILLPTWWGDLQEDVQVIISYRRHGLSKTPWDSAMIAGFRFPQGVDYRHRRRELRRLTLHFCNARPDLVELMLGGDITECGLFVVLPFGEPVEMVETSKLFGEGSKRYREAEAKILSFWTCSQVREKYFKKGRSIETLEGHRSELLAWIQSHPTAHAGVRLRTVAIIRLEERMEDERIEKSTIAEEFREQLRRREELIILLDEAQEGDL